MVQVMSAKIPSIRSGLFMCVVKKSRAFRVYILSIFCLGALLHIADITSTIWTSTEEEWTWKFMQHLDDSRNRAYFVDQLGCRMPSVNLTEATMEKYFAAAERFVDPMECRKPLVKAKGNLISIALSVPLIQSLYGVRAMSQIRCTVEPFTRKTDFENEFLEPIRVFKYGDVVKIHNEFVRVICTSRGDEEIYRGHFYTKQTGRENEREGGSKEMNVMIFGLDSVSRLNFRRQMKRTHDLLVNELNAFELFGYNKVADNTYPNLMPVLTGLNANELKEECLSEETFDDCNFIWDDYKNSNYTTVYMEDTGFVGLFQYNFEGFKHQPTDIYLRPLVVEMERSEQDSYMCLGGQRTIDVLLDNMRQVTSSFTVSESPQFAFFWTISFTHDHLNTPRLIDTDIAEYIRELSSTGALNNTFLFLMSDHGMRWGDFRNTYEGMIEERQPFLFLIPPQWFVEKYPTALRNLAANRHRLTTHFDLHETLRDLLNHNSLTAETIKSRTVELTREKPMPRGISLFLPVPGKRTCRDAHIEPHWCTCHEREALSLDDPRVLQVAELMVDEINRMLKKQPQCQKLHLNSISDAGISAFNNFTTDSVDQFTGITVRLSTKPGLGEFEATVRAHNPNQFELTGTISRTNMYGKQSRCIDDFNLKLYCFCDSYF